MSEFINTIDLLGDDAVIDSIIDKSITEFNDDVITNVGEYAFYMCESLVDVKLPSVNQVGQYAFGETAIKQAHFPLLTKVANGTFVACKCLQYVDMPLVTQTGSWAFQYSNCIEDVRLPEVTALGVSTFEQCLCLRIIDLPNISKIDHYAFQTCCNLSALLIRNEKTVCTLTGINAFNNSAISAGTGYIYVPRSLIDSYKVATNWSTYASQIRAIEDYTPDGTVTGRFTNVVNKLVRVTNSNTDVTAKSTYSATLTPESGFVIKKVTITMNGEDITNTAYDGNGNIFISSVTGHIVVAAAAYTETGGETVVQLTPYSGALNGELPKYILPVTAGQILDITYCAMERYGFVYDGRACGLSYFKNNAAYAEETITINIAKDGYITFSGHYTSSATNGELDTIPNDRLRGKYLNVTIV